MLIEIIRLFRSGPLLCEISQIEFIDRDNSLTLQFRLPLPRKDFINLPEYIMGCSYLSYVANPCLGSLPIFEHAKQEVNNLTPPIVTICSAARAIGKNVLCKGVRRLEQASRRLEP
jgi:hypothetical protein